MKITIGIVKDIKEHACKETFDIERICTELPRSFKGELIEWSVEYKSPELKMEDLLDFSGPPSVLLLHGQDKVLLERIRGLERQMQAFVRKHSEMLLVPSSVIAVLPDVAIDVMEFPDIIADWVYVPVSAQDLAHRILFSLKQHSTFKKRLHYGGMTIIPETRQALYENRSVHLTPSEFILLELFLTQRGAMLPFKDLVMLFKATGKSAAPNNIRVAIFQLRLKLEILTKSCMTLVNVHGQGYCLRQKSNAFCPLHLNLAHDIPR